METGMEDLVVEELPIPKARDIVAAANIGLKRKHLAQKVEIATNGAYFLMGKDMEKVAIFKPANEEDTTDPYWRKGDKAMREVAAFLLDHPMDGEEEGFGGIPPTTLVKCKNFKDQGEVTWTVGSLQKFMPNRAWHNSGYSVFSIEQYQKMTVIDLHIGNRGRHKFNILMGRDGTLIPIDHGECFPKMIAAGYRFDWTMWPQATIPYLPEIVAYVKTIDIEKDLSILRANGIALGAASEFVLRVHNLVLKEGILGGYLPTVIGHLMLDYGSPQNVQYIVQCCKERNTTGDQNRLMEDIRMNIKFALEIATKNRRENERISKLLADKDFQATSKVSKGKAKTEVVEAFTQAFTGLIIEHEHDHSSLETNTHRQMQSSGSQKPVSRFKANRGRESEQPSAVPKDSIA